jgi:hypothetical protein
MRLPTVRLLAALALVLVTAQSALAAAQTGPRTGAGPGTGAGRGTAAGPAASAGLGADVLAAIAALPSTESELLSALVRSLRSGSAELPFDVTRYRADESTRVRLIQTFGPMLRRIVASSAFAAAYAADRQRAILDRVGTRPVDPAETRRQQLAELRQMLAQSNAQLGARGLSREARASLQQMLATLRTQVQGLEREAADAQRAAADAETFAAAQREWEQAAQAASVALEDEYPAAPKTAVSRRLQAFLDLTAGMPWSAVLREQGGMRVFADPALEARPRDWKLCFRAGRATIDAARAFAQSWLTELQAPR